MSVSTESRVEERILVSHEMDVAWRYASGSAMERFCASLREHRIEALRCDGCGRRYLPPRPFCGRCHLHMSQWSPVLDEGTLEAFTVVHIPILDGATGKRRPSPYGMGLIRLDGADTTLNHFLRENDHRRLRLGLRVRAVWRNALRGAIDDIEHFEVIDG